MQDDISQNLIDISDRVGRVAQAAGRSPNDVLIVAISKTIPLDRIRAAVSAGQVHFGENRVQEARDKIPQLPDGLIWHLVGHLQSNKTKYCPDLFHWIHSIDSIPLAREVARRYRDKGKVCRALVQVSVSGEEVKFGCEPDETADILKVLIEEEGTEPVGLMTMPPFDPDPEVSRPWFRALRQLRDDLVGQGLPEISLKELSMGMTGDFEVAVEEGATIVRIGTAIFGERDR
ncbi:MAG: YggS family pyridoxal phosphate-dependent enzyme [bacterium]|nr:MAG: YggS family pyridoxal phosphate-dependent enzyme [bacterium]